MIGNDNISVEIRCVMRQKLCYIICNPVTYGWERTYYH